MIVVRSSSLSLIITRVSSSKRKRSGSEGSFRTSGSYDSDGDSCSGRDSDEGVDVGTALDSGERDGSLGELSGGLGETRRREEEKLARGR